MDLFQNRFPSSGFLTWDFKRLMSSCGFSRRISFIRFLASDFRRQVVMCESVSNVNNKQIKRKF